jgi:hypothetical protein
MSRQVQRKPLIPVFDSATKAALAGLLALLLLTASTLSVNHALHQRLHATGDSGHGCLVCSFSKGQVTPADVAPILVVLVAALLFALPLLRQIIRPAVDRRLATPRGPPVPVSSSRVVG